MQVTNIRVDDFEPKAEGICAEVTVTLDKVLTIHKIHVINGKKGLFIAFPNTGEMKRYKNSKRFVDIVHPIDKNLRQHIEEEVLLTYEKMKS